MPTQTQSEEGEVPIQDEPEEIPATFSYSMTSWGADYALETLVQRLNRGIIFVPPFQRKYVWKLSQASRFIESLLLGLPVPGVFFYKEESTGRMLIVDGQQRLETVRMFFQGNFNTREFALTGVTEALEGRTYATLDEEMRNNLNDTVIHATIVRQERPEGNQSSIYQIFERLNSGGTQLQPQEIRSCIYYGNLVDALHELNANEDWRVIFGPVSQRAKDQELILRFIAFRYSLTQYSRPLSSFLTGFLREHRDEVDTEINRYKIEFRSLIAIFRRVYGRDAFRPNNSLNAAVFDSVMVALAEALERTPSLSDEDVASSYGILMNDAAYLEACSRATGDLSNVTIRFSRARAAFSGV